MVETLRQSLSYGLQGLLAVMIGLAIACIGDGFQSIWSAALILLTVLIVLLIRKRFSHALHTTWGKTGRRAKVFFGALAALLAILVPYDRAMGRLAPALAQSQLTRFLLTADMYLSAAAICFVLLLFLFKWSGVSSIFSVGIKGLAALVVIGLLGWWVVETPWTFIQHQQQHVNLDTIFENMLPGQTVIEQDLEIDSNHLQTLTLYPSNVPGSTGTLLVEILRGDEVIFSAEADLAGMEDARPFDIPLGLDVGPQDQILTLRLMAEYPEDLHYFSMFYSDSVSVAGRYSVGLDETHGLRMDGQPVAGMLCFDLSATEERLIAPYYWGGLGLIVFCWIAMAAWVQYSATHGKRCFVLNIAQQLKRFSFLIQQLVSRDFSTKYRQSLLGVLWSFLNPLLTTFVLYFVFSTIFQSSTPNFTVYLLSGLVMYNFFTEATSLGLEAITANANLINKVYVPRYIYPLSRVFSSVINLAISIVPLIITCLVTGLRITKAYFLLPFPLLCICCFACGMSFLLATCNVFFRDTKFLWGIITMLWMYLTPLFYPETIIPAGFLTLYHMNPLYQFIYFLRCIVIDGVTPQPIIYLYSLLGAIIPLLVGILVFNREQHKFVMYL